MKEQQGHILNTINDIIEISKIEANELELENKSCVLPELFESLKTNFNEIIKLKKKKKVTLKCVIPNSFERLSIKIDPDRLEQILTHLIDNAVKFTDEGKVEFGYKVSRNHEISFFVNDEGCGIPKEKQEVIINRFRQLETTDDKKEETGLGLAISGGTIDLFSGKFSVRSEVGKGSSFSFTIPLIEEMYPRNQKKIKKVTNKLSDKINLLVVDDEPVNIQFFKELFDIRLSVNATYATNGVEAVEAYKKNPSFDVILMDIRMPVMDGVEAANEIRKINPKVKIIAQTAYAMVSDRDEYIGMGFSDYLSKPIDLDSLINKLNYLSNKKVTKAF